MSNAMDHFKGDQDPAVRTWQDATEASMAMSTSAQARRLTDELGQLRRDYNAILLERNEAWSQLARADQIIRDAHERAEQARAELAESRAAVADVEKHRKLSAERLLVAERERDQFIAAADKLHGEWLDLKAELALLRGQTPWTGEQTDTDAAKLIGEAIQAGECGQVPCEHAPDGGNHPGVGRG